MCVVCTPQGPGLDVTILILKCMISQTQTQTFHSQQYPSTMFQNKALQAKSIEKNYVQWVYSSSKFADGHMEKTHKELSRPYARFNV